MPSKKLRVVATGAESTGKTTLVQALAAVYEVPWVPEYARHYAATVGHVLTVVDVDPIAQGHLQQAEATAQRASNLVLYDTDLLSTVIYSRYLYGNCPAWVEAAAREHAADLYLLCAADIAWVPDLGQRESPEARSALQPLFETLLDEWALPYVCISGSAEARQAQARAAIDDMLLRDAGIP